MMQVKFSKSAIKFLKKLNHQQETRIKSKIVLLRTALENKGALPFDELDIKKLKGTWQGFYRIRSGQSRIIFTFRLEAEKIYIYDICFRGDAYD